MIRTENLSQEKIIELIQDAALGDIHHIIEVAFDANIEIGEIFELESIANAHEAMERGSIKRWIILKV